MSGTIRRAKLTRSDLAHWDGKTATYSRVDASGGTIAGLVVNDLVDIVQVFGSGANFTRSTIATALQFIGTNTVTLLFAAGTWTIDNNLTIPSNFTCKVPAGCVFNVSSGKTLTFSGKVIVEYPVLWTSGSGTVTVTNGVLNETHFIRTAAEAAASVTPTNYFIPSHDVAGCVYPQRYGWSTAASGTNNYTYLVNAHLVAAQALCPIVLGGGAYSYKPSAELQFLVDVQGAGPKGTTINVDTSAPYSGKVFRVTGRGKLSDITIADSTLAKRATLIYLANTTDTTFSGYFRLTKVEVYGGAKNIEIANCFSVTLDQVRSENGTEGLWCVPPTGGGQGYATTCLFLNCIFTGSARNVHFNSSINSLNISFVGGAIESATGATAQSDFQNVSTLAFDNFYTEGATSIPWLSCTAIANLKINGLVENTAGSLVVGDNSSDISIKNVYTVGASSTLGILGTTNRVSIENCSFPSSGNTFDGRNVSIINSTLNGTKYGAMCKGNATNGFPGFTGNGPVRIRWQQTVVSSAGANDVFRFLDEVLGTAQNSYITGHFYIRAIDTSSGANFANYTAVFSSAANGTGSATLTQTRTQTGGTDPGTSATPFSTAADGGGGAVKIQFTKNAAVSSVTLDVSFVGQLI